MGSAGNSTTFGAPIGPSRADPGSGGRRIYLVDPDPAVRSSLRWLVAHLPVEVETFARGEDLLAAVFADGPACVVTDVNLPGMSGLDLVRALRKRANGRLPVIVLATHSDIPTAVAALRAGAVDFFEKPFGGRALARRIEEALEASAEAARNGAERADR